MKRRTRGDFGRRLVQHMRWVLLALRFVLDVVHLIANWPLS
jgi:hypothetical protein